MRYEIHIKYIVCTWYFKALLGKIFRYLDSKESNVALGPTCNYLSGILHSMKIALLFTLHFASLKDKQVEESEILLIFILLIYYLFILLIYIESTESDIHDILANHISVFLCRECDKDTKQYS